MRTQNYDNLLTNIDFIATVDPKELYKLIISELSEIKGKLCQLNQINGLKICLINIT